MFRLAHPWYLFLLLPIAIAAWWVYRPRVRAGILFSALGRVPSGVRTWRVRLALAMPALFVAGLVSAVGALARPQTVWSRIRRTAEVIAIQIVCDASGSMEALDLSVRTPAGWQLKTRLDVVKEMFIRFIEKRPDDLIGLITFGGYVSVRAPLTSDHDALRHILHGVDIPRETLGPDGQPLDREELLTAIGDALVMACARLEGVKPRSRIIVLLSDGESNTGAVKPEEATEVARKMGIRVYTIGVGSTGRAPFRTRDRFGRETIAYAEVSLDEDLLRHIAERTGGKYFNARDPRGLQEALEAIERLEKTRVEKESYVHSRELFPWFLTPALAFCVTAMAVNGWASRRIL